MSLFYSAKRAGFFDDTVHTALPDDAVAITAETHARLLKAQSDGATIQGDARGRPVARRAPVPIDQVRAAQLRAIKAEAGRRILAVAPLWQQLNDARKLSLSQGDRRAAIEARYAAIDAIRAASDAIEAATRALPAAALRAFDPASSPLWPASKDIQP